MLSLRLFLMCVLFSPILLVAKDRILTKSGTRIICNVTKTDSLNVYFDFTNKNDDEVSTYILNAQIELIELNFDKRLPRVRSEDELAKIKIKREKKALIKSEPLPRLMLGLGNGVNFQTGFCGVAARITFSDHVSLHPVFGISVWGNKYSLNIQYNKRDNGGLFYGMGYTYCSGLEDVFIELNTPNLEEKTYVDFLALNTTNIYMGYEFKIGRINSLSLHWGYALNFDDDPWTVNSITKNSVVSDTPSYTENTISKDTNNILKILQPGGLIIGIIFNFGVYN